MTTIDLLTIASVVQGIALFVVAAMAIRANRRLNRAGPATMKYIDAKFDSRLAILVGFENRISGAEKAIHSLKNPTNMSVSFKIDGERLAQKIIDKVSKIQCEAGQ